AGILSFGNATNPACVTSAEGVGAVATCCAGATFAVPRALSTAFVGAGAGGGVTACVPAAASCWCLAQLSKSAGETVNVLKRMFAWLVPQYSTHAPFHAFVPAESGV